MFIATQTQSPQVAKAKPAVKSAATKVAADERAKAAADERPIDLAAEKQLPVVAQEFLCVRCAKHQPTCCQGSDIYVTPGDVKRIAAYTGQRDFYEHRAPVDPVYLDQDDDPAWMTIFQPDGKRRVLRRQPSLDCVFLGDAGCRLPLETRPLICRLYPFDYVAEGIVDRPASGCPTHLLPPGQSIFEALDMKRRDGDRWHRQLYEEIKLEPQAQAAEK